MPEIFAVHGVIDGAVTGAHDLGETEEADSADQQASHGGLKDLGPIRKRAQPGTQGGEQAGKEDSSESADNTQDGVGQQLAAIRRTVNAGTVNMGCEPQK